MTLYVWYRIGIFLHMNVYFVPELFTQHRLKGKKEYCPHYLGTQSPRGALEETL